MRSFRLLAVALVTTLAPLSAGCAEEDYDAREPAYPQAMGVDPPRPEAASATPPPAPYDPQMVVMQAPPAPGGPTVMQSDGDAVDGAPAEPGYAPDDEYADDDPSALTDFRSTLDPYGQWVDDPTYGTIWQPSTGVVGSDFAPYQTSGHWTYDDDDYTWVSDYDWGWVPFHYGRWVYANTGWGWIPGRRYAGAWVSWRYGYGDWPYVGWGPMAPTWGWRGGYARGLGFTPATPYGFCASGNLFSPNLRAGMVDGGHAGMVAAHTQPWNSASPSVNGHVAANPSVNGPPPGVLGIPASTIAHGGSTARGVAQARAFAHPGTAVALGARAPSVSPSRSFASGGAYGRSYGSGYGRAYGSSYGRGYGSGYGRSPAYGGSGFSHFGGKLGAGFSGSALNQRGGSYSLGSHPYYGASPGSHAAMGGMGRSYGGFGGGYGGFASGPHFGGGYGPHPGAAPQGGGGHHTYGESSGGGYHGGGGFRGGGSRGGGGGHGGGGRR
ncbi:MAG TPA: DUF6600 domain-containing protein [Polyangiaceae bacterium]